MRVNIQAIGGATQDIFMQCTSTNNEVMTITLKNKQSTFMLFESGEKFEVHNAIYKTGGGATNSATSFKRLGFQVNCFCKIGTDAAGQQILSTLNAEKIETENIKISNQHKTGCSVIIGTTSTAEDYVTFAYRGANGFIEPEEIPWNNIKSSNQLYITSLSHKSSQILSNIVTFAKQNLIPVAVNPGISQLTNGILELKKSIANIDILILNSYEAQMFMVALTRTDQTYKKILECKAASDLYGLNMQTASPYLLNVPMSCENMQFGLSNFFKEVIKMGPQIVVVTNGQNGVYVANNNEVLFRPSIKTHIVNTTGAGDAFGSCFVASLLLKYNLHTALKHGVINSSAVLEHVGAKDGLQTLDQLLDKAKKIPDEIQKFKI